MIDRLRSEWGPLPPLALVLGGASSGKSRFAENWLAAEARSQNQSLIYVATGTSGDAEMAARIDRHRRRRGPEWLTIEEPLALSDRLRAIAGPDRFILVDCLTLWLTNLLLAERDLPAAIEDFAATLPTLPGRLILVANEVGLGIVPENALAREFREAAGELNQAMAAIADRVVFVAAGLPWLLKPAFSERPRS